MIPRTTIQLPELPYNFNALSPILSAEAMRIHYLGHHKGYVDKFNKLLHSGGSEEDLEFNYHGHLLHSLYWKSFTPKESFPGELTLRLIQGQFPGTNSVEDFLELLFNKAMSLKGSGWVVVSIANKRAQLLLHTDTISNHNITELWPNSKVLFVLDVWEHAFYLDYANKKNAFFKQMLQIIDWDTIEHRVLQSLS